MKVDTSMMQQVTLSTSAAQVFHSLIKKCDAFPSFWCCGTFKLGCRNVRTRGNGIFGSSLSFERSFWRAGKLITNSSQNAAKSAYFGDESETEKQGVPTTLLSDPNIDTVEGILVPT